MEKEKYPLCYRNSPIKGPKNPFNPLNKSVRKNDEYPGVYYICEG